MFPKQIKIIILVFVMLHFGVECRFKPLTNPIFGVDCNVLTVVDLFLKKQRLTVFRIHQKRRAVFLMMDIDNLITV